MTAEEFKEKFGIVGRSRQVKDLVDIVMQVAKSDISVLIYGESGTGKEVFARAIHDYSSRADEKLVSVNCGAIPEGILESELFGHKKGSFTGAFEDRKGYFEIADKGTLFLDEIGEMPLTTQVKLLRVLETKEFMRIGSEITTKVNVRIIAASNKDLQEEVDAKRFRKDLYFRLKAVSLTIPPLRSRKEDIHLLAKNFLEQFSYASNQPEPVLSKEASELLLSYSWPGNIRELKNAVETAAALSKTRTLNAEDFLPLLTNFESKEENRLLPVHLNKPAETLDREMLYRALYEIKKDLEDLKDIAYRNEREINSMQNGNTREIIPLDQLEKEAIVNTLNYTHGSKRKAANLLGISERTLYRKLKDYDIQ